MIEAIRGGIIAAGAGRRLQAAGFAMPKPLVPVAGEPLLAHVVTNFLAAGIRSLTAIVNEDAGECRDFLHRRFPDLDLRCIVKTTQSSLDSFFEVVRDDPSPGRMLISTVDAVCRPRDFARFAAAAVLRPREATVLGITPLVADENPLWVHLGAGGCIRTVGASAGPFVTAGVYLVSERVRRMPRPAHLSRLRDFLGWLVVEEEPVYGEIIETVVDVDRREDVVLAEALVHAERTRRLGETRD